MMKIWYQSLFDAGRVPAYFDGVRKRVGTVARPGTEVHLHSMPKGAYGEHTPAEVVVYPYIASLHAQFILDNALRAQAEGYDVFALSSVQDPAIEEARSLVDIPVVGYGEAAMHFACLLGSRFVIIAFGERFDQMLDLRIKRLGLSERALPTMLMERTTFADVGKGLDDATAIVQSFTATARKAIALGAEAIIPGQLYLKPRGGNREAGCAAPAPVAPGAPDPISGMALRPRIGTVPGPSPVMGECAGFCDHARPCLRPARRQGPYLAPRNETTDDVFPTPLPRRRLLACLAALPIPGRGGARAVRRRGRRRVPPVPVPPSRCGSARCRSRCWPTAWSPPNPWSPVAGARVDGQIEQVHVIEGQMVSRGQPLFTLDTRLNRARAGAAGGDARARPRPGRPRPVRRPALPVAPRRELRRPSSASSRRRRTRSPPPPRCARTEAQIAQTRLNLDYATITAEIDGRLGALPHPRRQCGAPGESTALATITQVDPILVQFAVPERWLGEIKAAMARRRDAAPCAPVPDQSDAPAAEGKLVFVDSSVDTNTGTILLKARFANPDLRLWPGPVRAGRAGDRGRRRASRVARRCACRPGSRAGSSSSWRRTARRAAAPVELARTVGDRAVVRGRAGRRARRSSWTAPSG